MSLRQREIKFKQIDYKDKIELNHNVPTIQYKSAISTELECPLFKDVHLTRVLIIKICSFLKCPSYWGVYLALYQRGRYSRKFYMKRLSQDPTPYPYIYAISVREGITFIYF